MKKPLEFCVNGDGRPVQRPSWVLCIRCLADLDKKIHELLAPRETKAPPPPHECGDELSSTDAISALTHRMRGQGGQ